MRNVCSNNNTMLGGYVFYGDGGGGSDGDWASSAGSVCGTACFCSHASSLHTITNHLGSNMSFLPY